MRNFIITLVLFTMLSVCSGKDNGKRQENVGNNRNDIISVPLKWDELND